MHSAELSIKSFWNLPGILMRNRQHLRGGVCKSFPGGLCPRPELSAL